MAISNVKNYLERAKNDFFKAADLIHKDYKRGLYTEDEYLEMMDVVSSFMMNGIW